MATSTIKMDPANLFNSANWQNTTIYQNRISDNLVRWFKIGNVVFVAGRFRTEMAINAATAIATGLPAPAGNTSAPLSGCTSNGATIVGFSINSVGSLSSVSALSNGTYYAVGGVYFSA